MEEVKEFLSYDPDTGDFTWIKNPKTGRGMVGKTAGFTDTKGYLRVKVRGTNYSLHRLAFLFMGENVPDEVDHEDRVKHSNKWLNLRPATPTQNAANKRHRIGKTGVSGVTVLPNGKFQVRIASGNKRHYLGVWEDLELAELIACEARLKYHKDFAYGG